MLHWLTVRIRGFSIILDFDLKKNEWKSRVNKASPKYANGDMFLSGFTYLSMIVFSGFQEVNMQATIFMTSALYQKP